MVDGKYEITESKVISGTQFINRIIRSKCRSIRVFVHFASSGFKRFLISNSREKQGILANTV